MAGPIIDVIASISPRISEGDMTNTIALIAARYGLGISFGVNKIRSLYDKEAEAVERLAQESDHPLVFTVTSDPQATDAHDIFRQLNPWKEGAKPSEAILLKFLGELWNTKGIDSVTFLLYEQLSPSSSSMPHYQMSFSQFVDWMTRYYEIEAGQKNRSGAEGIFTIRRKVQES